MYFVVSTNNDKVECKVKGCQTALILQIRLKKASQQPHFVFFPIYTVYTVLDFNLNSIPDKILRTLSPL